MILLLIVKLLAVLSGVLADKTGNHVHMEAAKLAHRADIRLIREVNSNDFHEVCFAIKQRNIEKLNEIANDVSFPSSPNYGKHWSRQQIADFTSNPASNQQLKSYLLQNHPEVQITRETRYGDYVFAKAPVKTWETMFNTKFHVYGFGAENKRQRELIRANAYELPVSLTEHISAVFNTVQFPILSEKNLANVPKKLKRSGATGQITASMDSSSTNEESSTTTGRTLMHFGPTARSLRGNAEKPVATASTNDEILIYGLVTPDLIKSYYDVTVAQADSSVTQVIYESLDDALNPDDLSEFQSYFDLLIQPISEDIGGHITTNACNTTAYADCVESNLDAQYIMGVAQNVPTIYWYTDDDWLTWVTQVADAAEIYDVYSISYAQYEFTISPSYGQSFDVEAAKIAVAGGTLFSSSGDDGVIGFIGRGNPDFCGYYAQFPTTSPYVTSVGGTKGPEHGYDEIACISGGTLQNYTIITTGGGFSLDYPRPSWQDAAINAYFAYVNGTMLEPYSNATESHPDDDDFAGYSLQGRYTYNRDGRGYPDVSLFAHNYAVVDDGVLEPVDGTSASTPVMAAFTVLVNYKRLAAGGSRIGWLNPFLYSYYTLFTKDIETGGANNCTALFGYNYTTQTALSTCCVEGYYTVKGWDPVTGLGSVNFNKFLEAALAVNPVPLSNDDDGNSLSGGAIAGIVIGVLVFVGLLAGGIYYYFVFVAGAKVAVGGGGSATLGTTNNPMLKQKLVM